VALGRAGTPLDQLEAEFGALPIADLSAFRIDKWKLARRKVIAASTVNRDLNVLKAMLAQAVTWKLRDTNPAAGVKSFKVPQGRVRCLMPDELAHVLTAARADLAAPRLVPAITLAVHTGLRQGNLLRLRWTDLAPDHTRLHPAHDKRRAAHIPLNADVRATLAALPRAGATVLDWPWGEPTSHTTLYAAFRRTCAAAGIIDFRWHDLPHTFASYLVMAGVELRTVQELLGHKDPTMTPVLLTESV
jgi:integrase